MPKIVNVLFFFKKRAVNATSLYHLISVSLSGFQYGFPNGVEKNHLSFAYAVHNFYTLLSEVEG